MNLAPIFEPSDSQTTKVSLYIAKPKKNMNYSKTSISSLVKFFNTNAYTLIKDWRLQNYENDFCHIDFDITSYVLVQENI